MELLRKIATPIIKKWTDDNLPDIAKKVIEDRFNYLIKRYPIE
jgi:cell pole-organizing protein PopZ